MLGTLRDFLGLAAAYTRLNFSAQLEYRGAFIAEVAAMFVNDCVWVIFWGLFFSRFPVLQGWDVKDVITVWAICAAGFGLAHGICGNALHLAGLVAQGQLDVWMLYPRALLPHLLLGRMNATAWGDALFGFVVYVGFVRPDAAHFALFTALAVSTAFLFVGFSVMTGSLGFYVGNATALAEQWRFAMITFGTYPGTLFRGAVKIFLFTVVPAGFVNYVSIEALRTMSLSLAGLAVLGALGVLGVGTAVFYHGLGRYESGNLTAMRE